jgi:hypothetical protein
MRKPPKKIGDQRPAGGHPQGHANSGRGRGDQNRNRGAGFNHGHHSRPQQTGAKRSSEGHSDELRHQARPNQTPSKPIITKEEFLKIQDVCDRFKHLVSLSELRPFLVPRNSTHWFCRCRMWTKRLNG